MNVDSPDPNVERFARRVRLLRLLESGYLDELTLSDLQREFFPAVSISTLSRDLTMISKYRKDRAHDPDRIAEI